MTHAFVGDGVCNDETNIAECDYDGGDCCPNPNLVGDAICHDEINHLGCNYDGGDCCSNPEMVGNGFCDEQTNNFECAYDDGECCGPDVSCKWPCFFLGIVWNQTKGEFICHTANDKYCISYTFYMCPISTVISLYTFAVYVRFFFFAFHYSAAFSKKATKFETTLI